MSSGGRTRARGTTGAPVNPAGEQRNAQRDAQSHSSAARAAAVEAPTSKRERYEATTQQHCHTTPRHVRTTVRVSPRDVLATIKRKSQNEARAADNSSRLKRSGTPNQCTTRCHDVREEAAQRRRARSLRGRHDALAVRRHIAAVTVRAATVRNSQHTTYMRSYAAACGEARRRSPDRRTVARTHTRDDRTSIAND